MRLFSICIALQLMSGIVVAQVQDTIYVFDKATTHVIFKSDLTYVDISDNVVAAKIVGTNKNILALKARSRFDYITTVSAMESSGELHTFVAAFGLKKDRLIVDTRTETPYKFKSYVKENGKLGVKEVPAKNEKKKSINTSKAPVSRASVATTEIFSPDKTPTLSEIVRSKQHLYHIGKYQYNIAVLLTDIFVVNDITYMVIDIENGSGISYDASSSRFVIESRKKAKRSIEYEKQIFPKSKFGSAVIAPGGKERIAYTFDKFTLTRDQVLTFYLYETGGSRNLILRMSHKDINGARLP